MSRVSRTTLTHLAHTIKKLWPTAQLLEGGELERPPGGFYQDVESPQPLSRGALRQLTSATEKSLDRSRDREARPHYELLSIDVRDEHGVPLPGRRQRISGIAHTDALALRREVARHEGAVERCAERLATQLGLVTESTWTARGNEVMRRLEKGVAQLYERYGYRPAPYPLGGLGNEEAISTRCFTFSPERRDSALCVVELGELAAIAREFRAMATELHDALGLHYSVSRAVPTQEFRCVVKDLYGLPAHPTADFVFEPVPNTERNPPQPGLARGTLTGGLEDFVARILERTAGTLPFWLCPTQVCVIPVSGKFLAYGRQVRDACATAGLSTHLEERNELMTFKRRLALDEGAAAVAMVGAEEEKSLSITLIERDRPGEEEHLPLAVAVDRLETQARCPF